MIQINILENDDTIESTDFIRQLDLLYTGQSDHLATTATYSGTPINHLRWLEVHRCCPAWVGKTVGSVRRDLRQMEEPHQPVPDYEFARGPIPVGHVLPETAQEEFLRVHQHFVLPFGKHKGTRAVDLRRTDPSYYEWAVTKGIIPHKISSSINNFA